jgi:hypothetical protein
VGGAHDYSDLHEIIERLEPDQADEVRAFLTRLVGRARRGRGSLRGQLVITPDWDSDEANGAIAQDFNAPE